MGVFDDKKFEELDWISQATEPIDSQLNEVLAALPEHLEIDFHTYLSIAKHTYHTLDINMHKAVEYMISKHYQGVYVTYDNVNVLKDSFKFEADGEVIIDFEKETLSGNLRLIKLNNTMDESVLASLLGREGINTVSFMNTPNDGTSRLNDIMELLGKCEQGLKSRSPYRKRQAIHKRLVQIFKANEWNIKDTELANKVGRWIADYCVNGNLAAYSNFCRIKLMTHKGQPIYSMEEVV